MTGSENSPKVTGLSPNEGTPGTKITIRGENLGQNVDDLVGLTICGVDCHMLAEWVSSSKIMARTSRCLGLGDVIVTTMSGGVGTCTVQFLGRDEKNISPTKESSVWVEEGETFFTETSRIQSPTSPGNMLFADPLGLKEVSNRDPLSHDLIAQYFPEVTGEQDLDSFGNVFSTEFNPAWYMLENHRDTSFDALVRGTEYLRKNITEKTPSSSVSSIKSLKQNVLAIIECLDSLRSVQHALKKHKQDVGTELTSKVEQLIQKSLQEAHDIFDAVLKRKDLADSTRNALNVLQRYRFLFNLPSSIEQNIQKNEFEIVINDFSRAKSLFADTQVRVFRRVYSEVETRIQRFTDMLYEKLRKNCTSPEQRNIEELKKLIQYLTNLEVVGNPGWESLVNIKQHLMKSLYECHEKHLKLVKSPPVIIDDAYIEDEYDDIRPPQAVKFIEELTQLFNSTFPDLVKLGTAYINGDLYTKETEKQLETKESIFQNQMIQQPIQLYVTLVRCALLPNGVAYNGTDDVEPWPVSNEESFFLWFPRWLCIVNEFYVEISRNDLPLSSLQLVQDLISDLRVHSLVCLFNQGADDIKKLAEKENWNLVIDDTIGSRTELPLMFERIVLDNLLTVRKTILHVSSFEENDIFSKIHVQGQIKQLAQNLLQAFLVALDETYASLDKDSESSSLERILVVVCNCTFTVNHVIPKLHESFEKYNYPDMSKVIRVCREAYKSLENKMFDAYVTRKCRQVVERFRPAAELIASDWYMNISIHSDVSCYVKEMIMIVNQVQSDVFYVAPSLIRRVTAPIVECLMTELAKAFNSIGNGLKDDGNLQAHLDLSAIEYVFVNSSYFHSDKSEEMLKSARSKLVPFNLQHQKLLGKQLSRFQTSMQLQLSCLSDEIRS